MRVSKVKVKVGGGRNSERMVFMRRTSKIGSLVYEDEQRNGKPETDDKTKSILRDKKRDSFVLSIVNKTICKKEIASKKIGEIYREAYYNAIADILKAVLNNSAVNEKHCNIVNKLTEEQIKQYLNHRFQESDKDYTPDKRRVPLDLHKLLKQIDSNSNTPPLQPYKEWAEWHIQTKSDRLIKSIQNNRLVIDTQEETENISPRKRALLKWENEFLLSHKLDLQDIEKTYLIDDLIHALHKVTYTINDKGFVNGNEYHHFLKKALQSHQQNIFGSRETPNMVNRKNAELYSYNMEVVKYLEHYFPVKKSNRRNTPEAKDYYLNGINIKERVRKQLENAVRNNLVRQGKYTLHTLTPDTVSSDNLSKIKADEGFALTMLNQCAFAANNVRNIIDPTQVGDILLDGPFDKSLEKFNSAQMLHLSSFFDVKEFNEPLRAIRDAVAKIRHNIIHYRVNALNVIFKIETFGSTQKQYKDTIFGSLLQVEMENVSESLAMQLMTGNVLEYYPMQELKSFFSKNNISLYRSVIPFAPGFKRVMRKGENYQNADKKENKNKKDSKDGYYDLKIESFLPQESFTKEAYDARYFLLKLIYNNIFLPKFTESTDWFKSTVNEVIALNREENVRKGKKHKIAFAEIRLMDSRDTIGAYAAYLQSCAIIEANKKPDAAKDEKVLLNFEKLILQTFIKGFDNFLRRNGMLKFVQEPSLQFKSGAKDETTQRKDWAKEIKGSLRAPVNDINPTESSHISFYVFCKLLDAPHLNDLRNELIKYYRSQSHRPQKIKNIKYLLSIIELCLLSVDASELNNLFTDANHSINDRLLAFLEKNKVVTDYEDLYTQSDNETMVLHRTIAKTYKYGTRKVLEQVIDSDPSYRVTVGEYQEWRNLKENVEEWIARREKLHAKWVKVERVPKVREVEMKDDMKEYVEVCSAIDRYNWLDNKVHLEHINKLHNLTIDLLGRMAGFNTLFERDLQYYCNCNEKVRSLLKPESSEGFDFSKGIPKFTDEQNSILFQTFLVEGYRDTRNFVAHFNFLNSFEDSYSKNCYSLIDVINRLRKQFKYDRKLKNAASKAIIKLFDKHGMVLILSFPKDAHELVVKDVFPRKITHFSKLKLEDNRKKIEKVETDMVSKEFCAMCKSLLELKK
jgi:hypothetical protein